MRKSPLMRFPWTKLTLSSPPRIKRLNDLGTQGEAQYLAGRDSRLKEFFSLIRIALELRKGMKELRDVGPAVTVFGSARFREDHPYYHLGRQVGAALAREGFTVM